MPIELTMTEWAQAQLSDRSGISRDSRGRFMPRATEPTSSAPPEGWRNNSRYDQYANPEGVLLTPSCGVAGCATCPPVSAGPFYVNGRYDLEGYDWSGYDVNGHDREGRDARGFNRLAVHRNGTDYDSRGFNSEGLNSEGLNSFGYDRYGWDTDGYNSAGYDRYGYNRNGYARDGYNRGGYDQWGERRPCDCGDCPECDERSGSLDPDDDLVAERDLLHYYNYTPALQFRGERPPFYGMEIEVTTDQIRSLVNCVDAHAGDLIYCKADGSVDGAELVTHPMSYEWAMANFPWQVLPALKDEADATVVSSDNGIHVHVSRDGFDNSSHLYRWLKFWYRNPEDIQRIARRRSNSWSAFRPEDRAAQIEHVKQGKRSYRYDQDETLRNRYSAINTTNEATLEVRVFASTLRPRRAQAALQLVAGSVEYTRQLTADAITHRHGWDWRAFTAWAGKSGQYQALVMEDRTRRSR